jgi:hypothetical protein
MIMGLSDGSLEEVENHFGRHGRAAPPGLEIRVLPGLDHSLALRSSRDLAIEELSRWVATLPET